MDFDLRAVAAQEVPDFLRCNEAAFGILLEERGMEPERHAVEIDRSLAVFDGVDMVATAGAFSFELTLPGLTSTPAAGVSYVGVLPTHRRRGLLRAMMRRQLDDVRERGEAIAVLTASEGGIYGRYGYGLATFVAGYEMERPLGLDRQPDGAIQLVSAEVAADAFPTVFDEVRRQRPGEVGRNRAWWDIFFHDREDYRNGGGPLFHAVSSGPGNELDGYVSYRFDRSKGGPEAGMVRVEDLCATTSAGYADLWAYVCDIDLTRGVQANGRRLDEPLRWLLPDPRRLRLTWMQDHLWVRLVDLPAALRARRYAARGKLVVRVDDGFCPWNDGTWQLEAGLDGADVRPAPGDSPDLSLSVADLGSTYLGGLSFSELARGGRMDENTPGALAGADAMFRCDPLPFCGTEF